MKNWIKNNKILTCVVLVCIGFGVYYLINSIRWITTPYSVDYGEGFVINYAKMWANGSWKWGITEPPYLTMVYGVGYNVLLYPFIKIFGSSLEVGRMVSFGCSLVTLFMVYLIVKKITGNKVYGLIGALLPVTQPIFRDWSVMARVDMPAVMFDLIGVYLVLRLINTKYLYLAVIPFVCAVMIKLSAIAGVIACLIYLFIYYRKSVWLFGSLFAGLLAVAFIPMVIVSHGEYLKDVFIYQPATSFNPFQLIMLFRKMIFPFILIFVLSIIYVRWCWKDKVYSLPSLFFIVALVWNMFTSMKDGSAEMYYFETILAGCICASLVLPYLLSTIANHKQIESIAVSIVLVVLSIFYGVQSNILFPDKQYIQDTQKVESLMSGNILTEVTSIAYEMGKPLYIEYFLFTDLSRRGIWDESKYLNMLQTGKFDYILLRSPIMERDNNDGHFTSDDLKAIKDNYNVVYQSDNRTWQYRMCLYQANE